VDIYTGINVAKITGIMTLAMSFGLTKEGCYDVAFVLAVLVFISCGFVMAENEREQAEDKERW